MRSMPAGDFLGPLARLRNEPSRRIFYREVIKKEGLLHTTPRGAILKALLDKTVLFLFFLYSIPQTKRKCNRSAARSPARSSLSPAPATAPPLPAQRNSPAQPDASGLLLSRMLTETASADAGAGCASLHPGHMAGTRRRPPRFHLRMGAAQFSTGFILS